jgi:Integrase core domain
MNRTIKEATVKRFHYDTHAELRSHLADFVNAYNFAKRLKTLKGLTPYEYICKAWTKEPERFTLNPLHHMPGLQLTKFSNLPGSLVLADPGGRTAENHGLKSRSFRMVSSF